VQRVEHALQAELSDSSIFTHLEPIEDPLSWADTYIERRLSR